jgi:hypothetical protein
MRHLSPRGTHFCIYPFLKRVVCEKHTFFGHVCAFFSVVDNFSAAVSPGGMVLYLMFLRRAG